ncbi:hypothetical protein BN2127_JRS10_04400 [Bacillus subtilis]|nr:hypothetical protein BN2127_JRS10_04400 [Bacillus subtilis]
MDKHIRQTWNSKIGEVAYTLLEWLKDYRNLEDRICYLENNLLRSKREWKRWVYGDLQDVRLTEESEGAKLEERVAAIEYELAHRMNAVYDLEKMIYKFKGLENKILRMKYMEGMTLSHIASELNYSADYIKRKHAEIMKMIKFVSTI